MKKYMLITICLFIFAEMVSAQQKKSSFKFSSINSMGLVSGQSQTTFTMQTINGVKYKSWFTGVGISLDNYGYRSIPVFVDIRKSFGNKEWQPFIYADAGINFSLYSSVMPKQQNGIDANKFYNTFYGEGGIGLSKPINNKTKFILSVGYSFKHFSYLQYNNYYYTPVLITPYTFVSSYNTSQFDFYYRRLSIKMGLEF